METKPKKTLSEEQIKKMQLGRKLAYEKKKKERELERNKAKEFVDAKKDKNKEKLLKLEMEALQQQQDRIDNLKIQVERKKEVKSKLKMAKQEEAEPVEQSPREIVERELEEQIDEPIIEKILDLKEEVEVDMAGDEKEMPDEKEEVAFLFRGKCLDRNGLYWLLTRVVIPIVRADKHRSVGDRHRWHKPMNFLMGEIHNGEVTVGFYIHAHGCHVIGPVDLSSRNTLGTNFGHIAAVKVKGDCPVLGNQSRTVGHRGP